MKLFYFSLPFILCVHASNSMIPDLDVFDEFFDFSFTYLQNLEHISSQIEQALRSKNNLDTPLNIVSKMSALHEALDKPQLYHFVELLLQAGANPNHKDEYNQWTPLHRAATHKNKLFYLHLLLEYKADVNATNTNQETPLMFAVKNGNYEGAQLLLKHGANPNMQNQAGDTAFHEVCHYYLAYDSNYALRQNMVELLLHHGANPYIQNRWGETALDTAKKRCFDALAQLMENQKVKFAHQLLSILNEVGIAADINVAQHIAEFVYSSHA